MARIKVVINERARAQAAYDVHQKVLAEAAGTTPVQTAIKSSLESKVRPAPA